MGFDEVDESLTEAQQRSFGLYGVVPLITVSPNLTYDARNNPRSPRSGWYGSLNFRWGTMLVEDVTYLLTEPELRGYIPVGDRIVLAGRVFLGASLFETSGIPAPERYFAGGAQSQRGFANRRLAPSVEDDDGDIVPLGGEAIYEASLESRIHIFDLLGLPFGIALFVDAADVQRSVQDLRFAVPHYAAGTGLRLETPVGPVRFDVGWRLNRRDEIDPADGWFPAWHLTIGEAY
ncbi:MAG: BamA/TamA family outer membrane protein [Myxococcales bacterium]|nr:BamA/TamA family outer membrane protein [Myxococcales bacterium]